MRIRVAMFGGVHGVGKTLFCSRLSNKFDFEHVTASNLIRRHNLSDKNKTVKDIEKNQLILAKELKNYQTNKNIVLLDGHFCLLDPSMNIKNIPLEIFKMISPYIIVILIDKAALIADRLMKRDGYSYTSEQIEIMQNQELNWAYSVSTVLSIPIKVVDLSVDCTDLISNVGFSIQSGGVHARSS